MKSLVLLTVAGLMLTAGGARAGDAAVEKPIREMMAGFNAGDIRRVKAAHVAAPTIVDETHPFVWSGPNAFDHWLAQLTRNEAAEGKTDGSVWFGDPVRESVVGDHAYVFTPCAYSFKQHGQAMRETGTITFVLAKGPSGWKIAAWTWTSPEAQAVQ